MKNIPLKYIEKSWSYEDYRKHIDTLFEQGKTTGEHQSEAMLNYTKLNLARMRRLEKKSRLTETTLEKIQKLDKKVTWLVITEAWCGDAAQIIPVLYQIAEQNENINLRLVLRDENPELMDAFLTNGARSIPILIVMDAENREVLTHWGPRPEEVQSMVMSAKSNANSNPDASKEIWDEAKKSSHLWYAKDKTKTIQSEVLETLV